MVCLVWLQRRLKQARKEFLRRYRLFSCRASDGQSTVEYAVITVGFIFLVVALAAMWRTFEGGLFVQHALSVASHHVNLTILGSVADIFLY